MCPCAAGTPLGLAFLVERIIEADPGLARVAAPAPIQFAAGAAATARCGGAFRRPVGELATLTGLLRDRADTGGTVVISAVSGTAGVGKPKPGS